MKPMSRTLTLQKAPSRQQRSLEAGRLQMAATVIPPDFRIPLSIIGIGGALASIGQNIPVRTWLL